jgi:hypothetical protein
LIAGGNFGETSEITFYVSTDDGALLWVNGQLIINNYVPQVVRGREGREREGRVREGERGERGGRGGSERERGKRRREEREEKEGGGRR